VEFVEEKARVNQTSEADIVLRALEAYRFLDDVKTTDGEILLQRKDGRVESDPKSYPKKARQAPPRHERMHYNIAAPHGGQFSSSMTIFQRSLSLPLLLMMKPIARRSGDFNWDWSLFATRL
jgi:hypothetical protein